jgi:hypothetical protein
MCCWWEIPANGGFLAEDVAIVGDIPAELDLLWWHQTCHCIEVAALGLVHCFCTHTLFDPLTDREIVARQIHSQWKNRRD